MRPSYDAGALAGMAMTEKQGGSDVRANTTRPSPRATATTSSRPQVVLLLPSCDVFLTLAQALAGCRASSSSRATPVSASNA